MTSTPVTVPRRPTRVSIIATALVAGGVLLAITVDMAFLVLAALGNFGPGILRELGWLRDQDECQRQAARRAALLLAMALTTSILFRFFRFQGADQDQLLAKALTFVLFEVPLLASALALLRLKPEAVEAGMGP